MDSKALAARIEGALGSPASASAISAGPPRPRVADHELVRPIGFGSYGDVWLARSVTGQWRAVKVVSRARFSSDRPFEREFRGVVQFEPISRSHSGLIQVLHVGRDDAAAAFYYVMELADDAGRRSSTTSNSAGAAGDSSSTQGAPPNPAAFASNYRPWTLRSELDARGRMSVMEAAALGVRLSGALGHIHAHGLVHRDVKPSNVIFVQGQPKLGDLGLVATTNEARSFVGTEGFIPPEGPGTVKADLFALGRLLYEAATGMDRCAFPEFPRDLDSWPDREEFLELNEILARLCAPEPQRRSANAAEVAGDLNLLLAGRSIRRAYGIERRLRRTTRISSVALGVTAIAGGLILFQAIQRHHAEERAAEERTLRIHSEFAEHQAKQQLYTALLEQARATVRSGELGQRVRALEAIRRAASLRNSPELRREAMSAFALPDLQLRHEIPCGDEFTARQMDPNFERIAVCAGRGPVEVRRASDNRLLHALPAAVNLPCYNLTWSADGRFLAIKRDSDQNSLAADIEVWNLEGEPWRALWIRDTRRNVRAFIPGTARFLTSDPQGRIVTWDLEQARLLNRTKIHEYPSELLAPAPDGERIAAIQRGPRDARVTIHDASLSRTLMDSRFPAAPSAVAWSPRGEWLAVTDFRGNVRLLDPATGSIRHLGRHRAEAVTVAFDGTGNYLITGGWERSLICWDIALMQRAFIIELDSYRAHTAADGARWAALTPTGVQLYSFEQPMPRLLPEDLGPRLRFAAFSPDGRWLAAAADERFGVWDLRDLGPAALDERGFEAAPYWTHDGSEVFGSRRDDAAFHWRVAPAQAQGLPPRLERMELPTPGGFTSLSVRSNLLAWTTSRGTQIVPTDSPLPRENAWKRTAMGLSGFSPDGRWLGIYRGYTQQLYVYQCPDLELVAELACQGPIGGFQFPPRGNELAIASRGQIEFWNVQTWDRARTLPRFAGIPHVGVLAQPEGQGWWTGREFRFASLYDPESLEPLLPLPNAISPLAVSSDGRFLAASAEARHLQVWDLAQARERLAELGLDWRASR
jgi:serine/threonine protein kinase/WD40 repeat protein